MKKLDLTSRDWRIILRSLSERRDRMDAAIREREARGVPADFEKTSRARINEIMAKLGQPSA